MSGEAAAQKNAAPRVAGSAIHAPHPPPPHTHLARLRLDALCAVDEHDGVVGGAERAVRVLAKVLWLVGCVRVCVVWVCVWSVCVWGGVDMCVRVLVCVVSCVCV